MSSELLVFHYCVALIRCLITKLDNEAVRVIESMPKWKPGKNKDIKVDVEYALLINFSLK